MQNMCLSVNTKALRTENSGATKLWFLRLVRRVSLSNYSDSQDKVCLYVCLMEEDIVAWIAGQLSRALAQWKSSEGHLISYKCSQNTHFSKLYVEIEILQSLFLCSLYFLMYFSHCKQFYCLSLQVWGHRDASNDKEAGSWWSVGNCLQTSWCLAWELRAICCQLKHPREGFWSGNTLP